MYRAVWSEKPNAVTESTELISLYLAKEQAEDI